MRQEFNMAYSTIYLLKLTYGIPSLGNMISQILPGNLAKNVTLFSTLYVNIKIFIFFLKL